jgi:hypothetical protein
VRLVDAEQPDRGVVERGTDLVAGELLGRGEQEVDPTAAEVVEELLPLRAAHGAVERLDPAGRLARLLEAAHLVLHQRDQRGGDHGGAAAHGAGELVHERLPAARGEHSDNVVALEDRLECLTLAGAETLVGREMGAQSAIDLGQGTPFPVGQVDLRCWWPAPRRGPPRRSHPTRPRGHASLLGVQRLTGVR